MTLPALYHYSAKPLTGCFPVKQTIADRDDWNFFYKPAGLWLSVEDEWEKWCRDNNFSLHRLTHKAKVIIGAGADHLVKLETEEDVLAFDREYGGTNPRIESLRAINWTRVATEFSGIIIAPYQWRLRFDYDLLWYYGWDCASACVWDPSIIDTIESV